VAIASVGEFAVLGYESSYTTATNGSDLQDFASTFEGTRFRYLASGVHELLLPMFEWSALGSGFTLSKNFTFHSVSEGGTSGKGFYLSLLRPDAPDLPLSYSGFGTWYLHTQVLTSTGRRRNIDGRFAYGVATPTGQLPAAGTATYQGFGDFDGYATPSPIVASIDFATGHVEGTITPTYNDGAGGIFAAPALSFFGTLPSGGGLVSVELSLPGGRSGTLELQFAGPAAQELIFRFRGTIADPVTAGFSNAEISAVGVGAARRSG
jgi:hypothetical protein